ncbi:MAG: hypothetical protein O7C75_14355 [Verrucomicrobia bacterium]|nr:hypothetical protein [Verrucomicrobiota bacterium]
MTSLRFDYSGIGDSSLRTDCLSYEQSVIDETGLFLDYLQNTQGFTEFVLIGICSGADNALRVAVQDKRVIGCVAIDPLTKPTLTFYWRTYLRRAISLQSWKNLVRGRSDIIKKLQKAKDVQNTPDDIELSRPEDFSTVEALSALKSILERNARVCLVYSGGVSYYNYLGNYKHEFHSLQKNDNFTLIFFKRANHTFTLLYNQQILMQAIAEWLSFVTDNSHEGL